MVEKTDNAAPSQAPEVIIPLPRRGLRSVPGDESKVKEPKKVKAASVPPRRLGLKIGSSITAGVVGLAGIGIGFGENDKLPDPLQKTYDNVKAAIGIKDTISYDQDGTPVVDVTQTSEHPETTITPTTTVEQTTTMVEATTTTEAEIINAPEIVGLSFNQANKTYIAEAGNPYGLEVGAEAGAYIKDAFEFNGNKESAVGFNSSVIEVLQKKIYEETGEYSLALPIDFKESLGVKITETKIIEPSFLSSAAALGINVSPGAKIYGLIEGEWSSTSEEFYTKGETDDKIFLISCQFDKSNGCLYMIYFRNAEVLPKIKNTYKVDYPETGKEIVTYTHDVISGEPVLNIIGEEFLDTSANKIPDRRMFEEPGDYQLMIIALLQTVSSKNNSKEQNIENKPLNILKIGQGEEEKMVFILSSLQKSAYEQPN